MLGAERAPAVASATRRRESMGRKPRKIKVGENVHVSFILDATTAGDVDAEAAHMAETDPLGRAVTRTDALRVLIREALAARRAKPRTK